MSVSLTVVCLPPTVGVHDLAAAAVAALPYQPHRGAQPVRHFPTRRRWNHRQLLHPHRRTAAGGPVRLLDLDGMRRAARDRYWLRWHVWQQVVAGTRPAQPYWRFADKHLANPRRYPLGLAQQHYRSQPRIAAMTVYNALPHRVVDLPTSHLEALEAGAHTYAHLGWLAAVPGDAVIGAYGTAQGGGRDRLAQRLPFLVAANTVLDTLPGDARLVAVTDL